MSLVIAQIINGLQTGSIFALVALGYSMVYGIILLLNFAHGDIIMVGAYMTFYAITTFHLHPLLSVVLAVVVSTLLAWSSRRYLHPPALRSPSQPPHYRHWNLLPAGERGPAHFWSRLQEHGPHGHRQPERGRH
jgi:branched-subunit amino acid ABC-type transport system permease component